MSIAKYLPAAVAVLLPSVALAAGGTPLDDAATNALDIAQGLGVTIGTAGLCGMGGGLAFQAGGGVIRTGAACAAGGGLVAGAGAIADTVLGGVGASGLSLSDLAGPAPIDLLGRLAGLFL